MTDTISNEIKYDVAVIGGGCAGICAAASAAKNGARTVLIESSSTLGGDLLSGLPIDGCISTCGEWIIGGMAKELFDECDSYGGYVGSVFDRRNLWAVMINPRVMGYAVIKLLKKYNVSLMPYTQAIDVVKDGDTIKEVIAVNKARRIKVKADIFIDATGDGDIAYMAGVPYDMGSENGELQPVSIVFQMRNVNSKKLMEFVRDNADSLGLGENPLNNKSAEELAMELYEGGVPKVFFSGAGKMLQKAIKENTMFPCSMLTVTPNSKDFSCVTINTTRVAVNDPTKSEELGDAMLTLTEQTDLAVNFLLNNVPGFENAYFDGMAPRLGVRETRRIRGEEILCGEDVMHGVKREDGICKGGHEVDIHGVGENHIRRAIDNGGTYDVPFKCLIPLKAANMLLAGRCLSADRSANSSARVMGTCMAMGQAAGTAAAMSLEFCGDVRSVDVKELRTRLKSQGAVLDGTR